MKDPASKGERIADLMDRLASDDGTVRGDSRESLVSLGESAVPQLCKALKNSGQKQVRWEAAKALDAISSPASIRALVKALEDNDPDVAWIAAEALAKFGKAAWPELFRALIKDGTKSVALRQGAHHVLCNQEESGFEDLLPPLLEDLRSGGLRGATMVAVSAIYKRIRDAQGKP